MASGITKDQVIYLLGGLSIYFVCTLIGDIRASMEATAQNAKKLERHEVRFAGYDGMVSMLSDIRVEISTIKHEIKEIKAQRCEQKRF